MTLLFSQGPLWPRWLVALGSLAALAPVPAHASGGARCTLSATPLAFGRYVPSRTSPSDFTATMTLTCTASGAGPVSILGSIALLGSGTSGRALAGGAHALRYQLFLDPGRTIPWGDGSGDSRTRSISGTVGPTTPLRETLTIYGRILARQSNAAVGSYADQIIAVLNY